MSTPLARKSNADPDDRPVSPPGDTGAASQPELFDVPAAVVCVHCGESYCAGQCILETTQSGIVHIVPWERSKLPLFTRLWSTARLTTVDAEPFFAGLPDGGIATAFRFALVAELCALLSHVAIAIPAALVMAPRWVKHVALDPVSRSFALRLLVFGLPLFALVLVTAHAAHGYALDVGAGRQGAKRQRTRALRFGLYAAGWDLVVGPFGFVVLLVKEGIENAMNVMGMLRGLPTRASKAFAAQHYRLPNDQLKKALRTSYWGAGWATVVAAGLFFAALLAIVLV
ncbi:MAG: hypothetical protein EOP08_12525, partial [Proteobacteria bacterium]